MKEEIQDTKNIYKNMEKTVSPMYIPKRPRPQSNIMPMQGYAQTQRMRNQTSELNKNQSRKKPKKPKKAVLIPPKTPDSEEAKKDKKRMAKTSKNLSKVSLAIDVINLPINIALNLKKLENCYSTENLQPS